MATVTDGDPFLRNIIPANDGILFLLFMSGYTTALMTFESNIYWFVSNSSDKRCSSVENGSSVLLKFKNSFEIQKYIQVAYLDKVFKNGPSKNF